MTQWEFAAPSQFFSCAKHCGSAVVLLFTRSYATRILKADYKWRYDRRIGWICPRCTAIAKATEEA